MKISIRTKFSIGILFFFIIILVLSIFSAFYLNRMAKKTSAILHENYLSVNYAREMTASLVMINQEITGSLLTNRNPDSSLINRELASFTKSLQFEKNNITEVGEDKLVMLIESSFIAFNDLSTKVVQQPEPFSTAIQMQKAFEELYQQLKLLSQMNEKAIELKTNDSEVSAKNALKQMTFLATLCFLIALSFTYRFASYFSERFSQLYKGIKEIGSSNYGQRLYFDGKDEFYDISLVFNDMAQKLDANKQKMELTLQEAVEREQSFNDVQELKRFLLRIKMIEEEVTGLISRFEKK